MVFLLQLALLLVVGDRLTAPPQALPDDAPAEAFSAARAMRHVEAIAREPHPTGSRANQRVRDYLIAALGELGLEVELHRSVQAYGYQRHARGDARFATVENIVARRRGTQPGPALLLMSHYDSVPTAPGAGDAASGVAAILEALRALGDAPLRNDVRVLFTDGEELGLMGAQAFFGQHPDAADTGLVLNFDARGSRGPVAMFETSDGNAALIGALAEAAPVVVGNSLLYAMYRQMPNDTDLSIAKAAGHAGLNFALVHGFFDYHSPTDAPQHLSADSLQHLGDYALPLLRHLGDVPLPLAADRDAHYFNPLGTRFVHYPPWVDTVLLALVLPLTVLVLLRCWRTRRATAGAILRGSGAAIVVLLLPALLVWMLGRTQPGGTEALLARLSHGQLPLFGWSAVAIGSGMLLAARASRGIGIAGAALLLAALLALAWWSASGWIAAGASLLLVLLAWLCLRRPLSPAAFAAGALPPLALLVLATWLLLPGGAYVLLWPLLPVLAAHLLLAGRPWPLLLAIALLPAMLLLGNTALSFDLMIGHALPVASVLPLLLVLLLALPLLAARTTAPTAAGLLLAGAALLGWLQVVTPWSERHPQPNELFVLHDHDAGQSWWASTDRRLDDWHRERLGVAPQSMPMARVIHGATGSASVAPLGDEHLRGAPLPRVRLLEDRVVDGLRRLRLRLSVDGGSDALSLLVPPEAELRGWRVAGQALQMPPLIPDRGWRLRGFALPDEGVELELDLGATDAALPTLAITSVRYALPAALSLPPRKATQMRRPYSLSDSEVSVRDIVLADVATDAGTEDDEAARGRYGFEAPASSDDARPPDDEAPAAVPVPADAAGTPPRPELR